MGETDAAVYSTKQVADSLGLGAAMIRKYAVALEKLTGEDIPIKRRDGRQFSREHFDTISKAKALVDSNNGLNIETALRMALGDAQTPGAAPALVGPDRNTLELTQALSEAIAKGNEPVIAELRLLRDELQQLQGTRLVESETAAQVKQLDEPQKSVQEISETSRDGMLVRVARWVESVLRR